MHRSIELLLLHSSIFLVSVLLKIECGNIGSGSAEYITVYLEDSCSCASSSPRLIPCPSSIVEASVLGSSAGFVFLSRDGSAFVGAVGEGFGCSVTIRSPPKTHVFVRLDALDLPMVAAGTCRAAVLRVFDGPAPDLIKQQLLEVCGSALPLQTGFWSTGNELTISYRQGPETFYSSKSFNITFTHFTTRKTGCREEEFRCAGGHYGCIDAELTCDGVDNCGDGSDESNVYDACGKYSPSSNPAVGGSVGVLVVLAVFGLVVGLGLYGANKRTQTRNTSRLPLPVLTNHDAAAEVTCRAPPEATATQRSMLPRMTGNGVSLAVIDAPLSVSAAAASASTTATTFRIVEVTPNPQRRQLQITVVPCIDFLSSHTNGGGGVGHRASLPPPYDSLFPDTGTDGANRPPQLQPS